MRTHEKGQADGGSSETNSWGDPGNEERRAAWMPKGPLGDNLALSKMLLSLRVCVVLRSVVGRPCILVCTTHHSARSGAAGFGSSQKCNAPRLRGRDPRTRVRCFALCWSAQQEKTPIHLCNRTRGWAFKHPLISCQRLSHALCRITDRPPAHPSRPLLAGHAGVEKAITEERETNDMQRGQPARHIRLPCSTLQLRTRQG